MKRQLKSRFLVRTLSNGVQCYNINKHVAPTVYEEILRISQNGFKIADARDEYDEIYSYLVAFDPINNEIISFYRYILCNKAIYNRHVDLSTAQYYEYVPMFVDGIMLNAIELGRSVINKEAKMEIENPGIGLNAIWRGGLGPLVYNYCLKFQNTGESPVKYLFGQASLQAKNYDVYDRIGFESLMRIFALFIKNFGLQNPKDEVVFPKKPLDFFQQPFDFQSYLDSFKGHYREDSKNLKSFLKENSMRMPNLLFHYGNLDSNNEKKLHMFWPIYNSLLDCYEMALCWDITSISDAHRKMFIGDPSDINLGAFE